MEKSSPTRMKLLELKGRYRAISNGLELIKIKREALMKEFFGVVGESIEMRERLCGLLGRGQRRLEVAKALYGEEVLRSFSHSAARVVSLDISLKNVWGVSVPEIGEQPLIRTLDARDTSPIGEKAKVFDVAKDFEAVADLLVKVASKEAKLSRIGEMIKADTRKVNAIAEVMLPSMNWSIGSIERVLEEREREEVFRLKRYKRMRSKRGV